MAERIKLRSGKPSSTTESLLESLREYTQRVSEIAGSIETQRTRTAIVGYSLMSIAFSVSLFASFLLQKPDFNDKFATPFFAAFVVVSAVAIPSLLYSAILRSKQYKRDLQTAVSRLRTTMSYASQIKDHIQFEKLDEMLMEMHLHEADDALTYAARFLGMRREGA